MSFLAHPGRHDEGVRLLLVCDYSLDYLGGAQAAFLQQVDLLRAAGHEVTVLAPGRGVRARWTLPILRLPLITNSQSVRDQVEHLIREARIELIHTHAEFGLTAACLDVGARLGIGVVQTVHTFFWQATTSWQRLAPVQHLLAIAVRAFSRRLTGVRLPHDQLADRVGDSALRAMTLAAARRATRVISPSAHQAERLRAAGLDHVDVIPNAGNPGDDHEPLSRIGGPLTVLWVGRCAAEKRILEFVKGAVTAVDHAGSSLLRVVVVGDGDQLSAARRLAHDQSAIEFWGRQPRDRVLALMRESHLVALSSLGFDNQPMTIVEAVLAGRGVLYCDPALTEGLILDDAPGPGLLTANPSAAGIAALLIKLALHPDDQTHPVIIASRATVRAREQFLPATFIAAAERTYRLAVEQRSGG